MDDAWTALSHRVQRVLGRPLPEHPDVSDPAFLELLGRLRQADPPLGQEVVDVITGTDARLPSEEEAAAEARRSRVRAKLLDRFFRPDALRTGRRRFNLRKTLNWATAAAAVAIVVWSVIPKSARVPVPTPAVERPGPHQMQPAPQPTAPHPSPAIPLGPPPAAAPPAPIPRLPDLNTAPLGFPPPADAPAAGVPMPPGLGEASVSPAVSGPVVYRASAEAAASPVAYQAPPQEQVPSGAVVYAVAAAHASGPPTADGALGPSSSTIIYQQSPPAQTSSGAVAGAALAPPQPALPRRGEILEARLITPVAVSTAWGPAPVLAEVTRGGPDGAVLFGQATLATDGVVHIQFSTLITSDGRERPFAGVAYDRGIGRVGIGGRVGTMMPGAAAATMSSTLQAASDYFAARARAQQVTITNGWLTITQGTPSFWDTLAGAVARAFAPQAGRTTGPAVVTRLDRGLAVAVMVM
jgi:hypothetical protein